MEDQFLKLKKKKKRACSQNINPDKNLTGKIYQTL